MSDPEQAQRRTGTIMIYAFWLVLLGLFAMLFQHWLDKENKPNRNLVATGDGPREVVLKRGRGDDYLAPGFINGQPVEFLVDTGATLVSIPARIAERIGLKRGPSFEAVSANGTIRVHATIVDELTLGNIVMHEVRASINPHMTKDTVLLGMSFMKHLEMIQRGDELTLRQP